MGHGSAFHLDRAGIKSRLNRIGTRAAGDELIAGNDPSGEKAGAVHLGRFGIKSAGGQIEEAGICPEGGYSQIGDFPQ